MLEGIFNRFWRPFFVQIFAGILALALCFSAQANPSIPESIRDEPDLAQLYRLLIIEGKVPPDLLKFYVNYKENEQRFPLGEGDHPAIERWKIFWRLPEVKRHIRDQQQLLGKRQLEDRRRHIQPDSPYFKRIEISPYTNLLSELHWINSNHEGKGTVPISEKQARAEVMISLGLSEEFDISRLDPLKSPAYFDPNFQRTSIDRPTQRRLEQESPAKTPVSPGNRGTEKWIRDTKIKIRRQLQEIEDERKNVILDHLLPDTQLTMFHGHHGVQSPVDPASVMQELREGITQRTTTMTVLLKDGSPIRLLLKTDSGSENLLEQTGKYLPISGGHEEIDQLLSLKRELKTILWILEYPSKQPMSFRLIEKHFRANQFYVQKKEHDRDDAGLREASTLRNSDGLGNYVLQELKELLAINLKRQGLNAREFLDQNPTGEETLYLRNTRLPSRKKAKFTDRRAQAVHTLNNTDTENSDPSTEERAKKKPGMGAWIKSTYSRVRGRFSHPPSPPVDPFKARAPMTAPKNNPYKNGKAIALFEVSQKPKGAEFIYRPTIYAVGDHTGVDLPTEASKHEQVIRPTTPTPLDNHWMPLFEHNTKVMSSLKATQDGKILEAGQDYEITQNREGLVMIRSTGTPLNEVKLEMGYSKRESPPTNHQLENLDPIVLRSITDDLMRSGLTVIAKQINSAIDQSSKTQRSFGLSELEKIIRDSSRYSFDSNRNADFSLSEQGPYAHLQPFLDSHGNLHMQCNGAAVLQSQLLNSYFERANLPFSAEFTRVFNIRSGIVTDQNLHAVVAIRQGKDGPVITYLDSTATVFGRFRDFLHRLKTRAKRTMLGVDYPEKMARSSSNFHGTLTESQDQESLMKKMEIAITPLRRIFREQESLRSYRPLQDPIRIISNSGNMNPHLAAMRAYRFINFLLDQNSQYSAPLSDMDQRHHQGETSPIETLPTRGTDNIGVLGEIDAHIEVLTSQLESHLNLIEIQSKKKKLPLGYSVYLRPEVSSHILDQLRTAIATLQEIRARPHLIHERAYTEFVPATDPFLDSNNHPEKYMPSHERKQFARLNSAQPGPGYCKKQKQTSSRD